jgi:hypothetical protein
MLKAKAAQKFLFAWAVLLFVLTIRLFLMTRTGVALASFVLVGFTAWTAFRLLERFVAFAWRISGVIAKQLFQGVVAVQLGEDQGRGE